MVEHRDEVRAHRPRERRKHLGSSQRSLVRVASDQPPAKLYQRVARLLCAGSDADNYDARPTLDVLKWRVANDDALRAREREGATKGNVRTEICLLSRADCGRKVGEVRGHTGSKMLIRLTRRYQRRLATVRDRTPFRSKD